MTLYISPGAVQRVCDGDHSSQWPRMRQCIYITSDNRLEYRSS